jgi:Zn-dependent protease
MGFFQWLLNGSVHLFTFSGVNVRAHSSMVVLGVLILLLGLGQGFTLADRVMTPLGGLAFVDAPRRPLATFITVAGGPMVNLVLMLMSAVVIYAVGGTPAWNPFSFAAPPEVRGNLTSVWWYSAWFFSINYWLLLFNLLPSYPLDGGQMLQTMLWRPMGYYKSMLTAASVGVVGAVAMMIFGVLGGALLLLFIGLSCLLTCMNLRQQLLAAGPYAFADADNDYSAASWRPDAVDDRRSAAQEEREIRRQQAAAAAEAAEQAKIDAILAKVGQKGMNSLTFFEKRALRIATERQRQRNTPGRR